MTDPTVAEPIVKFLIEQGTSAGLMLGIIYILIRKILQQYEIRIAVLEKASEECAVDRSELHKRIHQMKDEHIESLRSHKK